MDIIARAKARQTADLMQIIQVLDSFSQTKNYEVKEVAFVSPDIATNDAVNKLAKDMPTKEKYIYYFTADKFKDIPELFQSGTENSDIKYTHLNTARKPTDYPDVLYVGSSNNLAKRFKEHCGMASEKTYAIKFRDWLHDGIRVKFFYFQLDTNNQVILQNIEDGLWKLMQPIFGKMGGNVNSLSN